MVRLHLIDATHMEENQESELSVIKSKRQIVT